MNGNDVTACNLKQHTPKSVINVAILGAESTGKTTLCRDLAAHFGCPWVAEYMRTYLQAKWDKEQLTCTWDDLLPIAQGQIKLENELAEQAAQIYADVVTSLNFSETLHARNPRFQTWQRIKDILSRLDQADPRCHLAANTLAKCFAQKQLASPEDAERAFSEWMQTDACLSGAAV